MKDSVFLVLMVMIKALVSLTEDDASSIISCNINMELLTWQGAMEHCKSKGGLMLPFVTGLGQTIDALHLQSDADIWTADHLTLVHRNDEYCGFNYLNSTLYEIGEVLYGDCYANRNYFCKTENGMLVVYNSTRDKVQCNYNVSLNDLYVMQPRIKPGYYWNAGTVYGRASTASTMVDKLNTQDILCGGYKRLIGRYYTNCTENRFSLCTHNLGSSNGNRPINNICFDGFKSTTTPMIVRQETTDKTDTSTEHSMTGMKTSVDYKTNVNKIHTQEDEQSSAGYRKEKQLINPQIFPT